MAPAVEANRISKRYGSVVAVEDLSFAVVAGEILGVLGPNGAGKTTAIRVLTTILEPSAGTFEVGGVPSSRPVDIRARIGVLPESAGYPGRQTGEEYLHYYARLYGHRRAGGRRPVASRGRSLRPGALGDRRLQPWHAPTARHRKSARQRAGGCVPGRADTGSRPGRAATDPGHDPSDRARARRDGSAQHASPRRGRGNLLTHPHPQQRTGGGRGDG